MIRTLKYIGLAVVLFIVLYWVVLIFNLDKALGG